MSCLTNDLQKFDNLQKLLNVKNLIINTDKMDSKKIILSSNVGYENYVKNAEQKYLKCH